MKRLAFATVLAVSAWAAFAPARASAAGPEPPSPLRLHGTVREGAVAAAQLQTAAGSRTVRWSELARLHVDPGAATLRVAVPGDRDAVEVPPCAGRGAVTVDGRVYAPPPGPFLVRLTHQASPHALSIALRVSSYEHRVACGEAVLAGPVVLSRAGLVSLDFPSPARRGGHAVLYVPPGHDVTRPGPLLVGLHPWNGDEWTYAAYAELLAAARAHDVVLLFPSGLGNSLYVAAAEREVWRAVAAASRAVAVDAQRVSVWGASMGGAGATTLGFHHPDRFATVTSFFGDSRYDLSTYVHAILRDEAGAHAVNALDVVENARHLPVWLFHGDADKVSPIAQSVMLADALKAHGFGVSFVKVPAHGHEGVVVARYIAEVVARAAGARAPRHPPRVSYRSVRAEDTGAYGVRLERAHAGDAFVDVTFEHGRVVVLAAENVRAIVLAPGALGAPRNAPVTVRPPATRVTVRWQ